MKFIGDIENSGKEITVEAKDFNLREITPEEIAGTGIDYNAKIMFQILSNQLPLNNPNVEAVIANSAIGLIVAGKATSVSEGVEKAKEIIASGNCINKLKEFIKFVDGDTVKIEEFESS